LKEKSNDEDHVYVSDYEFIFMNYAVKNLKFYGLFLSTFFLFSIVFSGIAMAENSAHTRYGFVEIDQSIYKIHKNQQPILAKISGIGDIPQGVDNEKATIIITLPDDSKSNHRIFSTSDGYFELLFPLGQTSQEGNYEVFVTFAGQVLGELNFYVEKVSAYTPYNSQESTQIKSGLGIFIVETDASQYTSGSEIKISGMVDNPEHGSAVTIKIRSPNNNLVSIAQINPDSDGVFSTTIAASGPTWKEPGDYTVEANHVSGNMITQFEFFIPSSNTVIPNPMLESVVNPPKRIQSVLTLEEPANTTYRFSAGSAAKIPLSGYLIADGNPVNGATISFFDKNQELAIKTRTISNGYFSTSFQTTGSNSYHEITAKYNGSSESAGTTIFLPDSSNTKSFDIIFSSPPPPPPPPPPIQPTQSEDWTGPIVGIIIALIVGGIIAVVAKSRKPKSARLKANVSYGSAQPSSDQSVIFHYACPNCSRKLQPPTSPNAGQNCLSRGWKS